MKKHIDTIIWSSLLVLSGIVVAAMFYVLSLV